MCSYFGDLLNCPLNFACSFIIIFPSPSGKPTPEKCLGGTASMQLNKAKTITLVRYLNCQATAFVCIISLKHQQFIHSYLVLKKKTFDVSFSLELRATSYTSPYLLSFLTWSCYLPLCDAINISGKCSQDWVSAGFCVYAKYGDVGYYSLLTACSISLNIFRAFGVLALVITRSQLGASAGEIQVNKHLPGCVTGEIYFRRELWSCLCA